MFAEEHADIKPASSEGGTIYLMLGLYLIVLAFFILLNAISIEDQQRRDKVVESVDAGFDFREDRSRVGSDQTQDTVVPLFRQSMEHVEGVIQSFLGVQDYTVFEDVERGQLFLTLKPQNFFNTGQSTLIPEQILFFEGLGDKLREPPAGLRFETEIVMQGDKRVLGTRKDISLIRFLGERSIAFTPALIEQELPADGFRSSAVQGTPRILLTFRILVEDEIKALEVSKQLRLREEAQKALSGVEDVAGEDSHE